MDEDGRDVYRQSNPSRVNWRMPMSLKERSEERRKRMRANRATDFQPAEDWDLDFWQRQTPQERLSALVAIRNDVLAVEKSRHLEKPSRPVK